MLGEIAEAMGRAVQDGLARHAGFTGLGETESLHRLIEEGPFETVQAYVNAIYRAQQWIRRAADEDYKLSAIVSGIVTSDAFRMQARD